MRVAGEGELEALLAVGRGEHLVAVGGEDGGDRRGEVVVVVDHQYSESLVRHPLLPPGPVCGHARVLSCARAQILSARCAKGLGMHCRDASRAVHLPESRGRGEETTMKGYGPDGGTHSPRIAGVTTFLRVPHVTQFDGVDVAVVGLPFDTGLAVRTGARFGPRAVREASLTIHPAYNPAQRVAVFDRLSVVDAGDVRAGRRLHRPQPRRHGGHARARCTPPAACRSASAATTPSRSRSCAPRRQAVRPARPAALRRAHGLPGGERRPAAHPQHGDPPRRGGGRRRRLALRPPRHARRPRLAGRVRAGARARLHRRAVGRPRPARHRRGGRGGRGDRRRARPSSPSTSTSSTRASRPAVGTPEVGGPSSAQALALIRGCRGLDLAGADVVEVVPELDSSHLTATVAATIAYELLSLMACSGGTCE